MNVETPDDARISAAGPAAAKPAPTRPREELLLPSELHLEEAEYRRLLGYPHNHVPSARARELGAWARRWYAVHGRPWIYLREVSLTVRDGTLELDGFDFHSAKLREHLTGVGARRAVLLAVGAGRACEERARDLWLEQKPDEYFFLEILGSAVVEHLVALANNRVCAFAEQDGLVAIPHYSPGYADWDVAEQPRLFELIRRGQTRPWPEELTVLPSGMLRPKKSLLAVVGLAPRTTADRMPHHVPCASCSFSPCQFRRVPYRHAVNGGRPPAADRSVFVRPAVPRSSRLPLTPNARYSVNARALAKWSRERVQLRTRDDGAIEARFRFDGTTCSNMGRPLAFDYHIVLGPAPAGFPIREAACRPAPGDTGHQQMCAYLEDGDALMQAIRTEQPLLGRPLDEVLGWARPSRPSGCYCDAESRAHKWGLALEAIHFALVRSRTDSGGPPSPAAPPPSSP